MVFTNLTATRISRSFLERITGETLKAVHQEGEIGIVLTGAARMRKLNKEYRGKDRPTDVLAFPYEREKNSEETFLLQYSAVKEKPLFGEVIICIPVAKKQARQAGRSFRQELAALLIHGILHVCGYDHERSEEDERIMFGLQERILASLKITNHKFAHPTVPVGFARQSFGLSENHKQIPITKIPNSKPV